MRRIIISCIFLISLSPLFAQNQSDSIVIKKAFGTVFKQNGKTLTPRQLWNITGKNSAANKEMNIARDNYVVATVIGSVGGFMVGWPMGTAMAGGDANWVKNEILKKLELLFLSYILFQLLHNKKITFCR